MENKDFASIGVGHTSDGNRFEILMKRVDNRVAVRLDWQAEPTPEAKEESRAKVMAWTRAAGMNPHAAGETSGSSEEREAQLNQFLSGENRKLVNVRVICVERDGAFLNFEGWNPHLAVKFSSAEIGRDVAVGERFRARINVVAKHVGQLEFGDIDEDENSNG